MSESDTERRLGWTSSDHGDYRSNRRRSLYRAFTRHQGEILRYGNDINRPPCERLPTWRSI